MARNDAAGALAALSAIALVEGRPVEATKLALAAWPRTGESELMRLDAAMRGLSAAFPFNHERTRFQGHEEPVASATLPADGRRVLTGSKDNSARLWEAETGTEIGRLEGRMVKIESAALSTDGNRALSGSPDRTARLWDISDILAAAARLTGGAFPAINEAKLRLLSGDRGEPCPGDGRRRFPKGCDGA